MHSSSEIHGVKPSLKSAIVFSVTVFLEKICTNPEDKSVYLCVFGARVSAFKCISAVDYNIQYIKCSILDRIQVKREYGLESFYCMNSKIPNESAVLYVHCVI